MDKKRENEQFLWDRIKAGDINALEVIYNRHADALYNYGIKIFQNSQLVEDSIHDLFLDLWHYRKNLSPVVSTRAYLYASLRRKIIKAKKPDFIDFDSQWDIDLQLLIGSREQKIIEEELTDEQTKRLRTHLKNLSPRQYEAIVLRFFDKMSYEDIGRTMEVNEQSVRNLVQRGLENLKKYVRLTFSLWLFCQLFIH